MDSARNSEPPAHRSPRFFFRRRQPGMAGLAAQGCRACGRNSQGGSWLGMRAGHGCPAARSDRGEIQLKQIQIRLTATPRSRARGNQAILAFPGARNAAAREGTSWLFAPKPSLWTAFCRAHNQMFSHRTTSPRIRGAALGVPLPQFQDSPPGSAGFMSVNRARPARPGIACRCARSPYPPELRKTELPWRRRLPQCRLQGGRNGPRPSADMANQRQYPAWRCPAPEREPGPFVAVQSPDRFQHAEDHARVGPVLRLDQCRASAARAHISISQAGSTNWLGPLPFGTAPEIARRLSAGRSQCFDQPGPAGSREFAGHPPCREKFPSARVRAGAPFRQSVNSFPMFFSGRAADSATNDCRSLRRTGRIHGYPGNGQQRRRIEAEACAKKCRCRRTCGASVACSACRRNPPCCECP